MSREGRKRGSFSFYQKKKRRVSSNKSTVIATADRSGSLNLCVATMGRIGKDDISRSIEKPLPYDSILCTDRHVSYKGFATGNDLNYITLIEYVNTVYITYKMLIQYALKKWIDNTFWGV